MSQVRSDQNLSKLLIRLSLSAMLDRSTSVFSGWQSPVLLKVLQLRDGLTPEGHRQARV